MCEFIVKNFLNNPSSEVVNQQMPSIVAGHIDSRHILNNMQRKTFIIGISKNVINYIGFTLILLRTLISLIRFIYISRFLIGRFQKYFLKNSNDAIDVKATEIKSPY